MALSKPKLATFGLLSSAGLGIAGIIASNLLNKETFNDRLKGTLLTTSKEDEIKWAGRVSLLDKDDSSELSGSLKAIKSSANKEKELQNWCNTSLKGKYSKEGQLFKDVQKYCLYSIKEKLVNFINTDDWKSGKYDDKLKNAEDNKLSSVMLGIKNKLKDNTDAEALKNWCISLEKTPFKNEEDQTFKDGKAYCTTE